MHRLILGVLDQDDVDHKDGDGLNNQRRNLRPCTNTQNRRNHKLYKNNSTGFIGVVVDKKKFVAQIFVARERIRLGVFETAEEAAKIYDKAAIKHFGEYASLNFPILNH